MKRPHPEQIPVPHTFIVKSTVLLYSRAEIQSKARSIQRELRVGLHDPGLQVIVEFGGFAFRDGEVV
jgi:hypothetical protein